MHKIIQSTLATRLREARRTASYKTATAAIDFFNWKNSIYRVHENGQNSYDAQQAMLYAKAYNCNESWLLIGDDGLSDINPNMKEQQSKFCSGCSVSKCPQKIQSIAFLLQDDPHNLNLLERLNVCVTQLIQDLKD